MLDRYHLSTKREAVNMALRHVAGEPIDLDDALQADDFMAVNRICVGVQRELHVHSLYHRR